MTNQKINFQRLTIKNPLSELVGYTILGKSRSIKVHGLSRIGPLRLEKLARENLPQTAESLLEIFYLPNIKVINYSEGDNSSIPQSRQIYFYYFSKYS